MNPETSTPFEPNSDTDLGQQVQDLGQHAATVAQNAADTAKENFQQVKDQASDQLEKAKVTFSDLTGSLRSYVAEHPFAAFGIGVVFGLMLRGRRH